jgi:DNA-binding CsgD family transcriptional regulator
METLSHNDILALNRVIGDIYTARDKDAFYQTVFTSVQNIIPYELGSFNDAITGTTRFLKVISASQDHSSVTQKLLPTLNAHLHEHPLTPHCFSGYVVKITDYASPNQFKATAIYNEYYRHLDIETQITFAIPLSRENVTVFALSRKNTDFSERDRLLLTLLRPHLISALRNATEFGLVALERDLLQKGAEAERKGVMLLQADGRIVCVSPFAAEMVKKYLDETIAEGDTLPGRLLQGFAAELNNSPPITNGGNVTGPKASGRVPKRGEREPLVVEREGASLAIRLLNDCATDDFILVMIETDHSLLVQNLQGYGLSSRETEVLLWLSKRKTNVEIAVILGMGRRTVEKHLEHIFAKLGVETRAAAVAVMKKEFPS